MKTATHCWKHPEGYQGEDCESCAKAFDQSTSLCSHCGREVTNAAFFKKTSPHFNGTCRPEPLFPLSVQERTVDKPVRYPMPSMPNYSYSPFPQTMTEFYKWWKVKPLSARRGTQTHNGPVVLSKVYKGQKFVVTHKATGWRWKGTIYPTLSCVATVIGKKYGGRKRVSGPSFFGYKAETTP